MRFSLGTTVSKVAAVIGVATRAATYVKDNLKIYFDFKSSRAKTLEFVGTGSTYFTTNDYMTASRSSATSATFSFSGWVKATDINAYSCIFSSRTGSDNDYETGINIDFGSGASQTEVAVINVEFGGDGRGAIDVCNTTIAFGVWFHLAITVSNVVTCYINGVAQSSTGAVGSPSIDLENMQIGARYYSSTIQRFFEGNLKNVAIWTRALSASEIQNIMHKTYSDLKGTELTHLVSWWGLDSSSDTYADSHGDNDGTNSGSTLQDGIYADYSPRKPRGFDNAPTAQADLIGSGSALFAQDADEYVDCGTSSDFNFSTAAGAANDKAFSISAWIYKKEVGAVSVIVGKSTASNTDFLLYTDTSNNLGLHLYTDIYSVNVGGTGNTALVINRWYHVASTYDGSGAMSGAKLYVDGVLQTISATTSGTYTGMNHESTTNLVIGNWLDLSSREFVGNIAQLGIFSAVLTQEQIQSISQKTYDDLSTSEKTNLVSWWGLDVNFEDENGSNDGTAA